MSIEFGFYNSINGDRKYNSEHMSRIFDGIINDGIYATYGDHMIVTTNPEDTDSIIIGTGRAWFNHTWTYVSNAHIIKGPLPDIVNIRIDAIVLDINEDNRVNQILWIEGVAGSGEKPSLINDETHHQYPLCYITRAPGDSVYIPQDNIENAIGTSACPFVTGIIETVNTDELILQWESQWESFVSDRDVSFNDWFAGVQNILNDEAAIQLNNRIELLETKVNNIQNDVDSMYNKVHKWAINVFASTIGISSMQMTLDNVNLSGGTSAVTSGFYIVPSSTPPFKVSKITIKFRSPEQLSIPCSSIGSQYIINPIGPIRIVGYNASLGSAYELIAYGKASLGYGGQKIFVNGRTSDGWYGEFTVTRSNASPYSLTKDTGFDLPFNDPYDNTSVIIFPIKSLYSSPNTSDPSYVSLNQNKVSTRSMTPSAVVNVISAEIIMGSVFK